MQIDDDREVGPQWIQGQRSDSYRAAYEVDQIRYEI